MPRSTRRAADRAGSTDGDALRGRLEASRPGYRGVLRGAYV
ncbi:hypothetical protein ACFPRL_22650 [Pseudoclavibacter helvolus]